jgi:phosphotransferase system enzyme I (PtsP)
MALVALGFRSISMTPSSIGPIKTMVLSLDAGAAEKRLAQLLETGVGNLRGELKRFAESNNVEI